MRALVVLIAALFAINSAFAQDLLVKRNGEKMRVKVLKITKKKVQFVRHGTELPVYTLPISDIDYIEYPMGDRDTFGRNVQSAQSSSIEDKRWHGGVPLPDGRKGAELTPEMVEEYKKSHPERWHGAVESPVSKNAPSLVPAEAPATVYAVGDIYDKDGVKGVVVMITHEGRHGTIMSIDEACLSWCTLHRKQLEKVGAANRHDGAENQRAVERYIAEKGLAWTDFPAFDWCRLKGEGWYLPSINEVWCAGTMYMGGSRTAGNRHARKRFNENLKAAGGVPVSNIMIYHSSTEDRDSRYALYSHMNSEPPYTQSGHKAEDLFVRAFHKF